MKGYHEKQLFFLASDRGGAKKKNLREKIEGRKLEKKEGKKKRYLIYPNFYPTIPERQNVPKRFRHFEKARHHHHMQECASH